MDRQNRFPKEYKTYEEMESSHNKHTINWNVWLPILLWIGCVVLGIIKTIVASEGKRLDIKDIINVFNSNTFSAFLSVIICKLYQYFTISKVDFQEKASGLLRKCIPATIIITVIYGFTASFDAAWNSLGMTILYFIINIVYVGCFFKVFLIKKDKE